MSEKKSEVSGPEKLFSSLDDVEALEHLHDTSVDPDAPEHAQAAARAMKLLMPIMFEWLKSERKRGTSSLSIFEALVATNISMLLSASSTMAKDHESLQEILKDHVFPMFIGNFVIAIDSMENSTDLHAERQARKERPN